jgi:hypothetical protein
MGHDASRLRGPRLCGLSSATEARWRCESLKGRARRLPQKKPRASRAGLKRGADQRASCGEGQRTTSRLDTISGRLFRSAGKRRSIGRIVVAFAVEADKVCGPHCSTTQSSAHEAAPERRETAKRRLPHDDEGRSLQVLSS